MPLPIVVAHVPKWHDIKFRPPAPPYVTGTAQYVPLASAPALYIYLSSSLGNVAFNSPIYSNLKSSIVTFTRDIALYVPASLGNAFVNAASNVDTTFAFHGLNIDVALNVAGSTLNAKPIVTSRTCGVVALATSYNAPRNTPPHAHADPKYAPAVHAHAALGAYAAIH
eukprot:CAMPEP_0179605732 /NCGR_PEP_ID=MMETSP0930-20121108/1065_1 /TAXON_ID=548131 ORGANISM="Ostreococcus mediterraneus, Strain clade-D-RCC1621" /NCGR_SAMPLE_ID=MMETSP0930 /ASSEMBLY_ACC=CAM_ASM_000580 /LENGTH=167 /DNA_ID=CAMNT_0021474155 /DNA_START=1355 /DNA_END=1855 /DNA_ORIENTATION=+